MVVVVVVVVVLRTFIWRNFARATNALCRQRWQYGYVTVYVSIAIYITNYIGILHRSKIVSLHKNLFLQHSNFQSVDKSS